jgi:hypothetical protein
MRLLTLHNAMVKRSPPPPSSFLLGHSYSFSFQANGSLEDSYVDICCCSGEENGRQPSRLEWKIVEQQQ